MSLVDKVSLVTSIVIYIAWYCAFVTSTSGIFHFASKKDWQDKARKIGLSFSSIAGLAPLAFFLAQGSFVLPVVIMVIALIVFLSIAYSWREEIPSAILLLWLLFLLISTIVGAILGIFGAMCWFVGTWMITEELWR